MAKAGKTHSSAAKRFKITKKGKLMHSKVCRSHLLVNKGRATKRGKYGSELAEPEVKRMRKLMPHTNR